MLLSLTPRAFGSFFIGTTLSTTLYGCTFAQLLYYLRHYYNRDIAIIRNLIVTLCLLDTMITIINVDSFWYYVIKNHGKTGITTMPRVTLLEHSSAATVAFIVHSIDLRTLWKLSAQRWYRVPLTVIAAALSAIAYGSALSTVGYHSQLTSNLWELLQEPKLQISVQTLTASAANLHICASLCWVIRAESAGLAPHSITRSIIRRYTSYTIIRNLAAALIELVAFIMYIGWVGDGSYYWTIFHIPSSKIYVNSILAVLNARRSLAQIGQDTCTGLEESIIFAAMSLPPVSDDESVWSIADSQNDVLPPEKTLVVAEPTSG